MPTYRGMDGSFKVGAATVLNVTQWQFTSNFTILDTSYMGLLWETKRTGMARWAGSITANLDYGDTLGQKVLIDALLGATPDGAIAAVSLLMATGKLISGAICLASLSLTAALNALISFSLPFEGNGPPTLTWA